MPFEFDEHTAVTGPSGGAGGDSRGEPRGDPGGGPGGRPEGGAYDAELSRGWVVGGGVNGGYLLAVAGRAISRAVPAKPDPIAMSAYYLSAATPGPARVSARVLRDGGSVATVAADLTQPGAAGRDDVRLTALATFGSLADLPVGGPDGWSATARPPALPPLEECVPGSMAPPEVLASAPFVERFDMRFDPSMVGWALGRPSHRGELQAWFRLADGREPDALSLLMVVDALPPVSMDLGLTGWAPTLELTVHVRAAPAPGWLRVRHATRHVSGGMFEEDCEVWDATDTLVAQSRQLARLPRS